MNENALEKLYQVVADRKNENMEGSYTCYLFTQGLDKILKKVGEECAETIIASKNEDKEALVGEVSDLFYHIMVLLVQKNIPLEEVMKELDLRSNKIGNLKQFKTTDKNS